MNTVQVKVRGVMDAPSEAVLLGDFSVDYLDQLIRSMQLWCTSSQGDATQDVCGQYVVEPDGAWFEIIVETS